MIARKYLYLIALAREKHFGRAAAACHVSPSTLSAAIRDLENELGVAVVARGQNFSGLTAAGECVLEHALRCAAEARHLKDALDHLQDELSGHLRLGVIPTALGTVASLSAAFAHTHPRVTLEVRALPTTQILQQLRQFQLDAGIVYVSSGGEADLDVQPLWQEEHVVLGTHALLPPDQTEITWADAARLPLCLLTEDMQNRRTIDETFRSVGCTPRPALVSDSILSLLAHASTGQWCAILPKGITGLFHLPEPLRPLPLRKPALTWSTGLVTLRREPLAPMVAALKNCAAELG